MIHLTIQAQKSLEKKQHIFEIAMNLFRKYGYNNTTIRDICKEAEITTGTFYNFYGDKFGILQEFYQKISHKRNIYLKNTPENLANPYQTIYNYFIDIAHLQNQFGKDLLKEVLYRTSSLITQNPDSNDKYAGLLHITSFLEESLAGGYIPVTIEPRKTAEYIVSCVTGYCLFWTNVSDEESLVKIAEQMLPMILSSITNN